ncbi:uncharacterized protein LTR77_008844 [Saxophila tyrrhenica]|uniref:DUF6590 domain-containing protein n=1 Tax=Saxophila tyrrhenica TaxID=1690608 RepID=A0AAV9P0F1_9PEZI|nr:hypothetical protein LTR77_008844 [Saxophila tyrrhenica]
MAPVRRPAHSVISIVPASPTNIPSNAGPPQPVRVAWAYGGDTTFVIRGLSNAICQGPRLTVSHQGQQGASRPSQVQQLGSNLSQMNVQGPFANKTKTWDPSVAPSPSQMTKSPASGKSQVTTITRAGRRIDSGVCAKSGLTKEDYKLGEIIAIPFHQPNMNPHVDPNASDLVKTKYGPVFSKRRMVVVLWIYEEILFCVPLYTWDKRGVSSRADNLQPEYVSVKNVKDRDFQNQGRYQPVEATSRKEFDSTKPSTSPARSP